MKSQMFCRVVYLTLLLLPRLVFAQTPDAETQRQHELAKKPQYERMLTGEDAETAEKLAEAIAEDEESDAYAEAIQAAKKLLSLRIKVQGTDHFEALAAKFEVSRLEAISAQSAEKRREWQLASSSNVEADSLEDQGQYVRAYSARKYFAELCQELLGGDHPDTAHSDTNLAANLLGQGKATEAAPLLRDALDIHRKVLGEDHPDTAQSYNNLAVNLQAQGNFSEATQLFQKALDVQRKVLGEYDPATATSYNNLATNLQAQGKITRAEPLIQKSLDICRKLLGEDHPDTATSYNNLASILQQQGRFAEAASIFQKALDIRRKVQGEEHPDTALSYNNLAMNMKDQGKTTEAQSLLQKVLEVLRNVLGEEHPKTATSYNNLAINLEAQGRFSEAAPLYQKTLNIRRKVLGEDHPDTARVYNNLAMNMHKKGKAAEAEPLIQKALDIRRKVFGEDHADTAQSYSNLAVNLAYQDNFTEAEPLFQKALDIRRKVQSEDHPDTALSYNNLAENLQDQGKATEASPLIQKALDIRRKVFGEDHPDTAQSYNIMALNLEKLRQFTEAAPLYQKALDIRRNVLGEGHPDTTVSYKNRAFNLVSMGKTAEAKVVLTQAILSAESSRLNRAQGIERSIGEWRSPRLLLAAIEQRTAPTAAWANLEATLARGLLDQQGLTNSKLTSEEAAELTRLQDLVTDKQAQILRLVSQKNRSESESTLLEQLISQRREAGQKLAAQAVNVSTREVASSKEIQAALSPEAALLMWIDVSTRSGVDEHFVCVVRHTGDPKWERLPGSGPEGQWTREDSILPAQLREELIADAPSQQDLDSYTKKLRAQRISPALPHLKGVKSLYVVGVEQMAGVPVSLLTQDYTIGYVPSGTFLARRGKPLEKPATMLALGDPTFPAKRGASTSSALPPGGLLIKQVVPGGTAANALLKADDVLVSYAGTNLETVEQLGQMVAAKASEKSIAIEIWRPSENKLAVYEIPPGKLGVSLAKEPAREAVAARNNADQLLASITRGGEWGELPGSQVELSQLTRLFDPGKVTALTRSEASEYGLNKLRSNGELTSFRYLHFATHGEASNLKAFESKLILAQDHPSELLAVPGEPWLNNELSAREVLEYWKLDADLVTLSACETAIGKYGGGDGMLGFAQAFLLAGSRSVCLSLWKVDDTATTLLMDRFYRNLLGKRDDGATPLGKAAALHEAQTWLQNLTLTEAVDRLGVLTNGVSRGSKKGREVIGEPPAASDFSPVGKPYSHPKYWAAFILIGAPD